MASNLRVDSIVPATGSNVSIGTATGGVTIPGDLGIAGALTYEDVTNIDSVGLITARSGINISSGSLTIPDSIIHSGDINTKIRFPEADAVTIETNGSERLRIASSGQIGLGGANYGTSGQVLTSQGSGSAVQWASPTPAAGSVVQTLSFFGAEETVGAQITTNKINDTFTPLYTGSKFAVWLTVPNITGQSGAYNTFTVYLGTSSTPQSNTQVIKVGQRTFGTSGQDDLMCLSSADYGNFTNSGTGTHYASLRVTSGQYPVTIARHSDGTDSMKVKLILQEIKQ